MNIDATKGDPTAPSRRAQAGGEGAGSRSLARDEELGTVVAYSTGRLAAQVKTDSGRLLDDVPTMAWPRDRVTLEVGDRVIIGWGLGIPVVRGGLAAGISVDSSTGLAEPRAGASFREAGDTEELIPGDWSRRGDRGHGIHVKRGGLSVVGGTAARLLLSENAGFVDLSCRRARFRSEWGDVWTDTVDGKTTMYLRGGCDQAEQNGGGKSRWTVGITAGAAADGLDVSVSDPDGRSAVRVHAGQDGALELRCVNHVLSVTADVVQRVAGNHDLDTDGTVNITSGGDSTWASGANFRLASAADVSTSADEKWSARGRSLDVQAAEKALFTAGNSADATGTTLELALPHGDLLAHADLGNFALRCPVGDGEVRAGKSLTLEGKQQVSISGARVEVAGATTALPNWDSFIPEFVNAVQALMTALQTGTVGSPAAQQLIALPAAQAVIQKFLSALSSGVYSSKKVRHG